MIHAYLTKPLYLQDLCHEVEGFSLVDDRLILSPHLTTPAFALDIWPNCEIVPFTSINDAIKQLKARSLRWYYYGSKHFRRGALIAEGVKQIKIQACHPDNAKHSSGSGTSSEPGSCGLQQATITGRRVSFGIFTLLSENELLVCKQPWKKWPCGEPHFVENKVIPPNRAYLKLWEALDIMGVSPTAGEFCIDLGASPGGWTWVLASTGPDVLAIDKSPLDPKIATMPNVSFQEGSAFALEPKDFKHVDWLCSDIICYPERSLALIQKWRESGVVKHIVCTIKLQGETDWATIKALQAIPQGRLTHLFQNKHELTFLWPHPSSCGLASPITG